MFHAQPPAAPTPVGWIEKDGIEGPYNVDENGNANYIGPTDIPVHINDTLAPEEIVKFHVFNPGWCGECMCNELGVLECDEAVKCNCEMGPWSEWTPCPDECDVQFHHRQRNITSQPHPGEAGCDCDDAHETQVCSMDPCKEQWSTWSEWNDCSATCGGGITVRSRTCSDGTCDETQKTVDLQTEDCNNAICEETGCNDNYEVVADCTEVTTTTYPITCTDLQNEEESQTSQDCVDGEFCKLVDGKLNNVDENGLVGVVEDTECPCWIDIEGQMVSSGTIVEINNCKTCQCVKGEMECTIEANCEEECVYSEWSEWSDCSTPSEMGVEEGTCCGSERGRTRKLLNPECDGPQQTILDTESCNNETKCQCEHNGELLTMFERFDEKECSYCMCNASGEIECFNDTNVVDGGMTEWTEWNPCSHECGGGYRIRTRECGNPPPRCGGSCEPAETDFGLCNIHACEVTTAICDKTCPTNEHCGGTPECEYDCRHISPLPNGDCPLNMTEVEDCVCNNGYVRNDDGECIPVNECETPCLLADGTPAPEGPFHLNGDECVTYECILGTVVETSSLEDYQATYCQFTEEICAALPPIYNAEKMETLDKNNNTVYLDQKLYNWIYNPPSEEAIKKAKKEGTCTVCGTCEPVPAECEIPDDKKAYYAAMGFTTVNQYEDVHGTVKAIMEFQLPKTCFCQTVAPDRKICKDSKPGMTKTCDTKEEAVKLEAVSEDGKKCISEKFIPYRYCTGGCDSEDFGSMNNDGTSGVLPIGARICECCTGETETETHPFLCEGGETLMFEIDNMKPGNCTCTACGVQRRRPEKVDGGIDDRKEGCKTMEDIQNKPECSDSGADDSFISDLGGDAGGAFEFGVGDAGGAFGLGGADAGGALGLGGADAGGAFGISGADAGGAFGLSGADAGGAFGLGDADTGGSFGLGGEDAGGSFGLSGEDAGGAFGLSGEDADGSFGLGGEDAGGSFGLGGEDTGGAFGLGGADADTGFGLGGADADTGFGLGGADAYDGFEFSTGADDEAAGTDDSGLGGLDFSFKK